MTALPKEKFNTTYFPESIVRDAASGCCHDVAIAIHRRIGLRLACIWQEPSKDPNSLLIDRFPIHVFCLTPDGLALDLEGPADLVSLRKRYERRDDYEYSLDIYESEADYARTIGDSLLGSVHTLLPREHGIAAADRVIDSSPSFKALLRSLSGARA